MPEKEKAPVSEPANELVAVKESEGRKLAAGTVLMFGNEKVTLKNDTVVTYDQDQSEQKFVGMCHIAGDDCINTNRKNLKFKYDGFGVLLPLREQVDQKEVKGEFIDDPDAQSKFIKGLTRSEAAEFGADSDWVALNTTKE